MALRKGKKEPFHVRLKKNRINATLRERQRLAKINQLLERLSDTVPQEFQGLATKVEIIRGVAEYIRILSALLQHPGLRTDERNTAHLVKKKDKFESWKEVVRDPNLRKASTELHIDKDRKMTSVLSPSFPNSPDSLWQSGYHLDPKNHSSLIPPGVVKMDDPPPSVIIDWTPTTSSKTLPPSTRK